LAIPRPPLMPCVLPFLIYALKASLVLSRRGEQDTRLSN
jgi:hypothetical protein